MSPGSRPMAGTRYSATFVFTASTSANRPGSKLPRETRTTAAGGSDSVMVIPSDNYITMWHHNIMHDAQTKAGRPRNPALDQGILAAAARQLGELGYARMSLESVAAAAGTTVPSLRRRYRSKAELAAAVIGSLRVEDPPTSAPTPRAHALAILENFHRNLRAIPALAILGSLLAEEERHPELLDLFKTRLAEPRRGGIEEALAAGCLPDPADLDALTSMLIGSF